MTKRTVTFLTLFGLAAVLVLAAPATAEDRATAGGENYFTQGPVTGPLCVYGFSKSYCDVELTDGQWTTYEGKPECPDRAALQGLSATLFGRVVRGQGTCVGPNGEEGRCDEVPELSGTLKAGVNVNALRRNACPGRGSWGGKLELRNNSGLLLAQGRLDSSLAVGTHRADDCNGLNCTPICEDCYNATFNPFTGIWELHSEGFLEAKVVAGPYEGCRIRAALSGRFDARGDNQGPRAPQPAWNGCFNFDGVVECPCD